MNFEKSCFIKDDQLNFEYWSIDFLSLHFKDSIKYDIY